MSKRHLSKLWLYTASSWSTLSGGTDSILNGKLPHKPKLGLRGKIRPPTLSLWTAVSHWDLGCRLTLLTEFLPYPQVSLRCRWSDLTVSGRYRSPIRHSRQFEGVASYSSVVVAVETSVKFPWHLAYLLSRRIHDLCIFPSIPLSFSLATIMVDKLKSICFTFLQRLDYILGVSPLPSSLWTASLACALGLGCG